MKKPVAFMDDAGFGAPDAYGTPRQSWPREFQTLAIVVGCISFWTLVLLAVGPL
jgi:hypothetical protein